jgi:hypothetical protein
MCTQKKWRKKLFILPLCFLLFTACNQNEPKKTDEPVTVNDNGGKNPQSDNVTLSGTLDTLYVDVAEFNKLPKKHRLMLSFTYRAMDTLTLFGWSSKKNDCESEDPPGTAPDIKLKIWRNGKQIIQPPIYFGNVFIHRDSIEKIKKVYDETNPKFKYVVFAPSIKSQHILYTIFVTNSGPSLLTGGATNNELEPTGVSANPSPPAGN